MASFIWLGGVPQKTSFERCPGFKFGLHAEQLLAHQRHRRAAGHIKNGEAGHERGQIP